MKISLFLFTILLISIPSTGQITYKDSCKENYSCYTGILEEKFFDSGYYVYAISPNYSYIEFSLPHFGRNNVKYRVQKMSTDNMFMVTKTYLYSNSASEYFIAIDSIMAEKIKIKKGGLKYLKKSRVYVAMRSDESIVMYYISKYLVKYNLSKNFLNFNPQLFVAWLKVKN